MNPEEIDNKVNQIKKSINQLKKIKIEEDLVIEEKIIIPLRKKKNKYFDLGKYFLDKGLEEAKEYLNEAIAIGLRISNLYYFHGLMYYFVKELQSTFSICQMIGDIKTAYKIIKLMEENIQIEVVRLFLPIFRDDFDEFPRTHA